LNAAKQAFISQGSWKFLPVSYGMIARTIQQTLVDITYQINEAREKLYKNSSFKF
jgi:hypothetical protein